LLLEIFAKPGRHERCLVTGEILDLFKKLFKEQIEISDIKDDISLWQYSDWSV
jgi:hypothetical protein